jgi:CheY-like chemotaxis protein
MAARASDWPAASDWWRPWTVARLLPPPGRRLNVLLAEDNTVNQRLGRLMLEKLGHQVDVVGNGLEATVAARRGHYDAVLMDVEMPVMDGLEATRLIGREPGPRPHIVAMTASVLLEDRRASREAGMDDYLSKPVRLTELDAALQKAPVNPARLVATPNTVPAVDTRVVDALVAELDGRGAAEVGELIGHYLHDSAADMDAIRTAGAGGDRRAIGVAATGSRRRPLFSAPPPWPSCSPTPAKRPASVWGISLTCSRSSMPSTPGWRRSC